MEIKREKYLQDLKDRMHNGMIKVVTGDNHIIGLSREARRN